jgi:cyanate lyase
MPSKELIHEEFGDGIMSAINFSVDFAKHEDPQGDGIVVTFNGKSCATRGDADDARGS